MCAKINRILASRSVRLANDTVGLANDWAEWIGKSLRFGFAWIIHETEVCERNSLFGRGKTLAESLPPRRGQRCALVILAANRL